MVSILTTEEQEKLRGRIWLPTVENPGDSYLSFADDDNIKKFKATIEARQPDVLVLDPWGAIIDGDELSDQDVRKTLSTLLDAISACSQEKPLPVIILNHSRMGIREMVKASGSDAANFGKNSKAIFTVMRNVWNLRRGSEEDAEMPIVELIHAKCSDHKLYPKSAVELNPDTLHYNHLPNFDHDAWQLKLENEANSKSQLSSAQKSGLNQRQAEANIKKILTIFANAPSIISHADYIEFAKEAGIGDAAAKNIKTKLEKEGNIVTIMKRSDSTHYYGEPAKAHAMVANYPKMYALKNKAKDQDLGL